MTKIVGHDWEDIQAMQQKSYVAPKIDLSVSGKPPATDRDRELLAQHGIEGLKELGLWGVVDRLNI